MASIYDLYVEQGSDFTQNLDMTGDRTGYSISMAVVDSTGNRTTGFVSWISDTLGTFKIVFTDVETTAFSSGVGKYNIEITDTSGNIDRILQGRIYVDGEV